jgi:nitroreductase
MEHLTLLKHTGCEPEAAHWAAALIQSRRTTLPKRLCGQGPDSAQRIAILEAASAAPDHGQLLPWRFIEVPQIHRDRLAKVFADALLARDPLACSDELAQAREKAYRSPWLLLAVCRTRGGDLEVPGQERLLSAGAAIQNMLLMATAMGLGSSLTSGKALSSDALRGLFSLHPDEDAICFINFGEVAQTRKPRPRPPVDAFFTSLDSTPQLIRSSFSHAVAT